MDEADRLVSEVLNAGRWPRAKTVGRFLEDGRLERLLSLYSQAMWLDASEPAYPWNLSSTLRRLGQNELASAFLTRAIHAGEQAGEDDYSGPDAYLALAEIAIDADEPDAALVAIARASERSGDRVEVDAYARRLLREIPARRGGDKPRSSLVRLLEAVDSRHGVGRRS